MTLAALVLITTVAAVTWLDLQLLKIIITVESVAQLRPRLLELV